MTFHSSVRSIPICFCLFAGFLTTADQVLASENVTEIFAPDDMIVYKRLGELELRLHRFNPPGHKPSDKRPAILFFFGGGWKAGSPDQFYPQSRYFASRGLVALSVEYRVESRNGTSPKECVADGKSAMRWVREHAHELGIDPHRIVAAGASAGGQVAAATATTAGFDEAGEDPTVDCRPNALVLFNPVFDNGPGGYGYDRVADYWEAFSPINNLGPHTPPTIVFLGSRDKFVPVATAEKFRRLMRDQGGRCDLHLYEGQLHGFFNYKNLHYYTLTVIEADKFLASLGYLQGPPTLTPST